MLMRTLLNLVRVLEAILIVIEEEKQIPTELEILKHANLKTLCTRAEIVFGKVSEFCVNNGVILIENINKS